MTGPAQQVNVPPRPDAIELCKHSGPQGAYTFVRPGDLSPQMNAPCAIPAIRMSDAQLARKAVAECYLGTQVRETAVLCKVLRLKDLPLLCFFYAEPGDAWSWTMRPGDEDLHHYLEYCISSGSFPLLLAGRDALCLRVCVCRPDELKTSLHASQSVTLPTMEAYQRAVQATLSGKKPCAARDNLLKPADIAFLASVCRPRPDRLH